MRGEIFSPVSKWKKELADKKNVFWYIVDLGCPPGEGRKTQEREARWFCEEEGIW